MANKFFVKLFAASCVISAIAAMPAYASNLAKVTGSDVNLRSYNSTEAKVIGVANKDETVRIISNSNNGWLQVKKSDGATGFISFDYLQVTQTDATCIAEDVNIRTSPSTTSSILGKAEKGQVFVTSGKSGDWYSIQYNNTTGYIYKDFMQGTLLQYLPTVNAPAASTTTTAKAVDIKDTTDVYAVVTASSLNLRQEPGMDGEPLKALPEGYNLTVNGYEDGWIKVTDDTNTVGYVSADFVSLKNGTKPANVEGNINPKKTTKVVFDTDDDVTGENLVEFSKNFIGTPYVWAGTDLENGVDCSGFVYSVYESFGIHLQRTSRDMYGQGEYVDEEELQAGDLLFFNSGGDTDISHVGMYIGDGQYIHSTNGEGNGVTISDLNSSYAVKTYVGARRILEDKSTYIIK